MSPRDKDLARLEEASRTLEAFLPPGPRPVRGAGALAAGLVAAVLGFTALGVSALDAAGEQASRLKRGAYLVALSGCGDCHTPGYLLGKPDAQRPLAGAEVGFEIPGLGVFYGPNLTPDNDTGLGRWSEKDIITTLRTGVRPDGRMLAPAMPWRNFAGMSEEDAGALVAYLKSLKPVANKVPGPFGAQEKPTSFVMKVVPPGE